MKNPQINFKSIFVLFTFLFLFFSCTKDSDLLADYAIADEIDGRQLEQFAFNDNYSSVPTTSTVLDVLSNDNFTNTDEVKITKTSNPINGIVIINDNKTLTYIPGNNQEPTTPEPTTPEPTTPEPTTPEPTTPEPTTPEPTTPEPTTPEPTTPKASTTAAPDTFTYTAEVTDNSGTTSTQQATVTINTDTSTIQAPSEDVAYWKELFDIAWNNPSIHRTGKANTMNYASSGGHGAEYYYMSWHLDGVIQAWQATGDNKYLDDALEIIETCINNATPVFGGKYLGWSNTTIPSPNGVSLYESYMFRFVSTLLRVMHQSPNLRATGNYQTRYDDILSFTEKHIWEKWEKNGNHNFYRSKTHMSSHWARIGMELYVIKGTKKYLDVFNNISYAGAPSGGQMPEGANLRNQLRSNPAQPLAYLWSSAWNNHKGVQDTSHGADIVSFWVNAYENEMYWDLKDMNALISTLNIVWKNNSPIEFSFNIDGSGAVNNREAGFHSFITLGRFNEELQSRIKSYYNINSMKHKTSEAMGIAALNRKILNDGRPIYPEIYN